MVQGRPVRSCTRSKMLFLESDGEKAHFTDAAQNINYVPCVKSRRITDYFQPVEAPEIKPDRKISTRCTRSKANTISEPQAAIFPGKTENKIKEDIKKEENQIEVCEISEAECILKSPPTTPHRITLCTETVDIKPGVKVEVKSFQKPFTPPKVRRKLNTSRFNVLEEPPKAGANRKLTNFLPVRKSIRKTKTTVLEEKQRLLEKILRNNIEEGLKISYFDGKGRGIVADKEFKRGDFVVEYSGDLIEIAEAKKREEMYAADQNAGCYMYYFEHNNHKYCIDATPESKRLGRLVNHSRNGNLMTKTVTVDNKPRLVLIAKEDIAIGQELLYDYGDRSRESLRHHPWLAY